MPKGDGTDITAHVLHVFKVLNVFAGNVTLRMIVLILEGSRDKVVYKHSLQAAYGSMSNLSKLQIKEVVYVAILEGILKTELHPTVVLPANDKFQSETQIFASYVKVGNAPSFGAKFYSEFFKVGYNIEIYVSIILIYFFTNIRLFNKKVSQK